MRTCKKCQEKYPLTIVIDGKKRNLGARSFCLRCSPFGKKNTKDLTQGQRPATIDSLSKDEFEVLVKNCRSRAEIFDKLQLRRSGASYEILNRRIEKEEIDVSHFQLGGAVADNDKYSNEDIFCKNTKSSKSYRARFRVLRDNLIPYVCKLCEIGPEYNGRPLTLELDHINGDRYDNRLENLRFLCPNCHSQTATFGAKRREQHESGADGLHP